MCCEETLTPRQYDDQAFWERIRRILVQSNDTYSVIAQCVLHHLIRLRNYIWFVVALVFADAVM